jgi:hypothetical protein
MPNDRSSPFASKDQPPAESMCPLEKAWPNPRSTQRLENRTPNTVSTDQRPSIHGGMPEKQ